MKHSDICILLAKAFFPHDWKLSLAMKQIGTAGVYAEENFWAVYNIFQDSAHKAAFVVQYVYLWWMYQYFSFHLRKVLSKYLNIFAEKASKCGLGIALIVIVVSILLCALALSPFTHPPGYLPHRNRLSFMKVIKTFIGFFTLGSFPDKQWWEMKNCESAGGKWLTAETEVFLV